MMLMLVWLSGQWQWECGHRLGVRGLVARQLTDGRETFQTLPTHGCLTCKWLPIDIAFQPCASMLPEDGREAPLTAWQVRGRVCEETFDTVQVGPCFCEDQHWI